MRRVFLLVAVLSMIVAAPNAAQAETIRFTAHLSGANEAPTPVLNGAFAFATVTLDTDTKTVSWVIDVFNLPSGMTAGHFHVGGPGLSGPTVVNLTFPSTISNDYRLEGSATQASSLRPGQGIRSYDDFLQALVGGQTYLNIHSQINPGGEIRGQVIRVP